VPNTVILAEDEATLYLQATTMPVWAPCGQTPIVRVDTQRDKVNIYGTLNLSTGRETVTETDKLDSERTAQHLEQILTTYPDRPILLLWDRAPWHGGDAIHNVLHENPRLELMRFPTAAPDLNPQEHVWKAARRAVSHNHTLRKLPGLADRFKKHLADHTFNSSLLDRHGFNAICPMFK
jgi:transposase